jgi:hypothetical protein
MPQESVLFRRSSLDLWPMISSSMYTMMLIVTDLESYGCLVWILDFEDLRHFSGEGAYTLVSNKPSRIDSQARTIEAKLRGINLDRHVCRNLVPRSESVVLNAGGQR